MDTSFAPPLADVLHGLPPDGPGRDIALQRLAKGQAASRAAEALHAAAGRVHGAPGIVADVLNAATAASEEDAVDGPARERLRDVVTSQAFLAILPSWISELRGVADKHPGTGACTIATAMQLWLWTAHHFRAQGLRPAIAAELAAALTPLLAARCFAIEVEHGAVLPGTPPALAADLCHAHAARVSAAAGSACAELVYGHRRHQAWDDAGCATCYQADQLDEMEGLIPGIASSARAHADVVETDGSHPRKAGPCAPLNGLEPFARLRSKLDGCLTGARIAKDRAAAALGALALGGRS